jgi:pilus assembly protein CpaC
MNLPEGVRGVRGINGLAVLLVVGLLLFCSCPAMALQVTADQSMLIDSIEDIRRVSIAKPEIADVEVISPRQLLVIGKSAGTTTLIYWNDREIPTNIDLNVGVNVDKAREDLKQISPEDSFVVSGAGDTLVLSGTVGTEASQTRLVQAAKAHAKTVINILTVKQLEQILLQIRVAEVDRSLAKDVGFNFLVRQPINGSTLAGFFGDINPPSQETVSSISRILFTSPGDAPKFTVFIRALDDKGALKVLAEPNLIVANGDKGKFLVGGEFPVVMANASGSGAAYSVTYKEYGIKLNFEPRIATNGDIYIKLVQEVSELDFANGVTMSGLQIPALTSRKAETGLQLADGQTFILAGLLSNKVSKSISKVPLLGDIPILGALFRSTRWTNNETELMVIVTPKIVRPLNKDEIPTLPTERLDPKEIGPGILP